MKQNEIPAKNGIATISANENCSHRIKQNKRKLSHTQTHMIQIFAFD